jgi:hypothetical protein
MGSLVRSIRIRGTARSVGAMCLTLAALDHAHAQNVTWAIKSNIFNLNLVMQNTSDDTLVAASPRTSRQPALRHQWTFAFMSDGRVRIQTAATPTRCLDLYPLFGGYSLVTKTCSDAASQFWRFDPIADGQGQFAIRSESMKFAGDPAALCLGLDSGTFANWTSDQTVSLSYCTPLQKSQLWSLVAPPQ